MFLTALVLPLQGFWNFVIYISTSMSTCRGLWMYLRTGSTTGHVPIAHANVGASNNLSRGSHMSG